jgi:hypothetical protein
MPQTTQDGPQLTGGARWPAARPDNRHVSLKQSEKVRQAIEQARLALGRPVDQGDLVRDRPRDARARRAGPTPIIRELSGEATLVLSFADVARRLGVPQVRVAAMVDAAELTTLTVGDFGARMVLSAEVERIRAQPDA